MPELEIQLTDGGRTIVPGCEIILEGNLFWQTYNENCELVLRFTLQGRSYPLQEPSDNLS